MILHLNLQISLFEKKKFKKDEAYFLQFNNKLSKTKNFINNFRSDLDLVNLIK